MFKCPVCYHRSLGENPKHSLETCSKCQTEFGIDDAGPEITTPGELKERHLELRKHWLRKQNACLACGEISWHTDFCSSCTQKIPIRCKICDTAIIGRCKQCAKQIRQTLCEELNYLYQSVDTTYLDC